MKSIMIFPAIVLLFLVNLIDYSSANALTDLRESINIKKGRKDYDFFKRIRDGDYEAVQDQAPGLRKIDWNVGLIIAALAGRDEIAKFLLEQGADVNYKKQGLIKKFPLRIKISPLLGSIYYASACYKTKICDNGQNLVAFLINKDANVNEVIRKGISVLALAAQMPNEKSVELLIHGGADVNFASSSGLTPLLRACRINKNYKVAEVLLKNKAEVNASDNHEWTALHYSVFNGFEKHVNVLLKYDADAFQTNENGKTAFIIAEQRIKESPNEKHRQRILELLYKC